MKAVVTGAGGQLGRALLARAPAGIAVAGLDSRTLDITDCGAAVAAMAAELPDVIINAAAYTAVDRAESEPAHAAAVNDRGVANLVAAAVPVGARVIHISTDFVFDGASSIAYRPGAPTGPLGIYGATKLAGERHLRGSDLCVRTAWLYGAAGDNFVRTMVRLLMEREEISVVADQIGSPTNVDDLADALWQFVLRRAAGLLHFANSGVASRYDFAMAIRDEGVRIGLLPRGVARVVPIASAQYPTPARRPAFGVLDSGAAAAVLGAAPRHWRHALVDTLQRMKADG